MYDRDGVFYRPPLNPQFVRKVAAKRKREERDAEVARQAQEMARIMARREELALERMERMAADMSEQTAAREQLDHDRVPVPHIIKMVAVAHGIRPVDITSITRRKKVIRARFEAIVLVAEARPEWSLPKLGRVFNRDHTSILHALKVMNAWPRKAA